MKKIFQKNNKKTEEAPSDNSPYSITEEILAERLKRPVYGNICRQVFAGFIGCLSSLSFGSCLGWAHAVSHIAESEEKEVRNDIGWLVSIILLGCSFGVTSSTFLLKQMGPKKVLRVVGPVYIMMWWLIALPTQKMQLAARFFLGFVGITYLNAGETLLQHTLHYSIKRFVTVFLNVFMILGMLLSRILSTIVTPFWVTLICAIIPMVHYILVQIVPESPVFLYTSSHLAAAKALAWYRGEDNIYMDMANIKKDWDVNRQDSDAYRYMMFSRVVYRALLLVLGIVFFQVCAGYFIFMFYSTEVLSGGAITFSKVIDTSIVCGGFLFSKLFWGVLHTVFTWKIRGFLIASCFISSLQLLLFALYLFYIKFHNETATSVISWIPMVVTCFFLFFYNMGLDQFPKFLTFQYMPLQMYKRAFFIVQTFFWLFSFLQIYAFAAFFFIIPQHFVFFFLSSLTFLGTIFCYFFVIEPTGKSLIQIQLEFGGNPIGSRGALYHQVKQSL